MALHAARDFCRLHVYVCISMYVYIYVCIYICMYKNMWDLGLRCYAVREGFICKIIFAK